MTILTDKQIDTLTAQYFCVFANKQIINFLQQATNNKNIYNTSQNMVKNAIKRNSLNETDMAEKIAFLNENWFTDAKNVFSNNINKSIPQKNGTVDDDNGFIANIVKKSTSTSTQAAIDTVTNAANQEKLAATASKTSQAATSAAVDTAIDKLKSNQTTLNQMAQDASSHATQGAIDTLVANNAELNNLAASAGASATKGAIDTATANSSAIQKISHDAGAAATSGALSALKGAAKGAVSAAMPWLVGAAITTISAMLWPKIKGAFTKMFRTSAQTKNSLAFVKFKDVDDNNWQFYFSKDKLLWKLDNMDSGENIDRQQTAAFMETQFAKKFMLQCQKYVRNVLDDKLKINILAKQLEKDSASNQHFNYIVENKAKIYDRMFNGKC